MLNAQFRPLERWPGERTRSRKDATFRANYTKTLDQLEYELSKLRAREIIIQVEGLTREDIRNDGWPRPRNRRNGYGGPGVILSFESPKGSISFPCDRYGDWQDNLRAIVLSLEALRAVDRYGVTRGNEQYRGWARLEAPKNGMTRQQAIDFIASLHGSNPDHMASKSADWWRGVIRDAKVENHPDRAVNDSDRLRRHELFVRIGQAEAVLCKEAA